MRERRGLDPEDTGVIPVEDTALPRSVPPAPGPVPPRRWLWSENPWPWLVLLLVAVAALLIWLLAVRDNDDGKPVPRVVGLQQPAAVGRLRRAGFKVTIVRTPHRGRVGRVFAQRPGGGSRLEQGQRVRIDVGSGAAPPATTPTASTTTATTATTTDVATPEVTGQPQPAAGAAIDAAGLVPNTFPTSSAKPPGTVVAQSPSGGEKLRPGAPVRLEVSAGRTPQPLVTVPDVTGKPAAAARFELFGASLTVRTVFTRASGAGQVGRVVDQQPSGGRERAYTQVTLTVGR